jgi:hypothetical protein
VPDQPEAAGEPLPPRDNVGCLYLIARTGCFLSLLQALMALAILLAALFSLLLFR